MDSSTLRMMMGAAGVSTAIEFIAAVNLETIGGATTFTINKPAGTAQNDLMLLFIVASTGVSWTPPSGWTEVLDTGGILIAHRTAGDSEGSSYTATSSGSANYAGAILTYRNAAYDTTGTLSTTQNSNIQTASSITMTQSDSTLLALFTSRSTSLTWSSPTSGLSSLRVSGAGLPTPSWALYSQSDVSSGATGDKSATASSTPGTPACLLFGIKPA
jgi:hypothetical protein